MNLEDHWMPLIGALRVRRNRSLSANMKSAALNIKDCAILIGYDPEGKCVYSDTRDLSDYYDGEHVWDSGEKVKQLRLQKVRGYLFNMEGILDQEFESVFDLETGKYKTGHARFSDGTVRKD